MSLPPPQLFLLSLMLVVIVPGAAASSTCVGGGTERCGDLLLPFPFHLNSSCTGAGDANSSSLFRLSCVNATLTFPLGAALFRVIDFPTGGTSLLLDYASPASAPCDPAYAALSRPSSPAAALDAAAPFLAVSPANVLRLYACEDSSLCRGGCDGAACAGNKSSAATGCCYPLSGGGVWKPGDGLAVFAGFGCRGFSSWVKNRSSPAPDVIRGIEMEWAVPRGSALAACASGATTVNATAVRGGVRCVCPPGLLGDGFAGGTGCSKRPACGSGGGECCQGRFCSKKAVALAGFFVSVFFLAAAASFWLFLRQPSADTPRRWELDPACIPKILGGICNARQFAYEDLDTAKRRFDEKAADEVAHGGTVHAGVLDDGTVVAVQRIGYETQDKLRLALDAVSLLAEASHRNIARVVGFCLLDPAMRAVLLVQESSAGGTLEDHLRRTVSSRGRAALGWHHRVNIAVELASALAYLEAHDAFLHDLRSSDVFLDADLTAKIAGHKLVSSTPAATSYYHGGASPAEREQDVVCNFGLLLMELLTGLRHHDPFDSVAPKVREGRLHEVLDPTLLLASSSSSSSGRSQQLPATAEEVRKVLELAVRCLLSAENEMGMVAAARELVHIVRGDDMGSSSKIEISLQDTFSSSSLLQMISMSPDTLHRHLP